jgi:hypothetical protein
VVAVNTNSSNTSQAHVVPGAAFSVSFDAVVANTGPDLTQYYVGLSNESVTNTPPGTPYSCTFYYATRSFNGSQTITLTAPSQAGIYYIAIDMTQANSCPSGNGLPNGNPTPAQYIGAIAVY